MESWSQEYVTQARERVIKPAPTSKNVVTIFLMDLQMVPNPKFPSKFPHQHERLFHTRLVCSKDIFYFPIQQKDTPCTNTEQFRIGAAALHGIGPRWYGTHRTIVHFSGHLLHSNMYAKVSSYRNHCNIEESVELVKYSFCFVFVVDFVLLEFLYGF